VSAIESPFAIWRTSHRTPTTALTPFAMTPVVDQAARGDRESSPAQVPDGRTVGGVLREVSDVLASSGARALEVSGVASHSLAPARRSAMIALLVHVDDIEGCVDDLEVSGFDIERTDPPRRLRAFGHALPVDIFRSIGNFHLDQEMLARSLAIQDEDIPIRTVGPEDLLVIKALADSEQRSQDWHDALDVIARCDLDWSYLAERARRVGPRRVLSLLLYAESIDLSVPTDVVEDLFATLHPTPKGNG
jgi:hypothetical protein